MSNRYSQPKFCGMIINKNILLPDIFLLNKRKLKLWLNIEALFMDFIREIGRNGVLLLRHMAETAHQIEILERV